MGTIALFPFVVVPGYFNITDFPKTLYLYFLSIIFLSVFIWHAVYRKIYIHSFDIVIFCIGAIFFGITYISASMDGVGSLL